MTNGIKDKSYAFAIRVILLCQMIVEEKREYVLTRQLLRSGTAIGALVREAEHGQSKADFLNKMNVALKEANETEYWLMLLKDTDYLNQETFTPIHKDCTEILRMLTSIVITTKNSLNRN